jgi:hypothetical protein
MLYCDEHICHASKCESQAMPGTRSCGVHVCAKEPCVRLRRPLSEFCSDHGCAACGAEVERGRNYCVAHECRVDGCVHHAKKGQCAQPINWSLERTNADHCCSDVCQDHKCRKSGCPMRRIEGSHYCDDDQFWCEWESCDRAREKRSQFCEKHSRAAKAEKPAKGGPCCWHRTYPDEEPCQRATSKSKRYCSLHACPDPTCDGVLYCEKNHDYKKRVEAGEQLQLEAPTRLQIGWYEDWISGNASWVESRT